MRPAAGARLAGRQASSSPALRLVVQCTGATRVRQAAVQPAPGGRAAAPGRPAAPSPSLGRSSRDSSGTLANIAQQLSSSGQQQLQTCWQFLTPATCTAAGALALGLLAAGPAAAAAAEGALAGLSGAAFIPGLVGDDPLREGFISAFLLIFFSEIGDKTFFIALLLALQQPRSLVFAGTFGALAVMTVISVGLGRVLHQLDELVPNSSIPLDDLLAVALLVFFGVQTLRSAATAGDKAAEEKEEAQEVVEGFGSGAQALGLIASTFALVFAAEWGDKSFLATIALSAASSPTGVVLGAVAGHGVATVVAVLGGSFLGKFVDERVVQYVGGSLFLVFAGATVFDIVTGAH